ncbi:MAG: hypothetical protein DMF78_07870 [Acidobacteria bacterium]|nr:MAG: hypothetical protein DMF78_07870 [Acidobacteriota bacterium]
MPPGEFVTMLTDYVLALSGLGAAAWLWPRAAGAPGRWWAAAFAITGIAAVLGGTSHGYRPVLATSTHTLVWRLTYVAVGLANLCVLQGAALAALRPAWARAVLAVLIARFAAVAAALVVHGEFRYVLYDYAITLLGLLAFAAAQAARRRRGGGWVAAGVLVSLLGAVVQLGQIGVGRAFNHNDVFHVLQALGLVLYARGGRDLVRRIDIR